MRRLLALSALALAVSGTAPAPASADEVCTPLRVAGACAGWCTDPCVPHVHAYAWCEHPLPWGWCDLVRV